MHSIWYQEDPDTMKRVTERTFNTRQAAHSWARKKGLIAFRVLRDLDSLPFDTGSPAPSAGGRSTSPGG